jgi:hypothetical protein
VSRRQPKLAGFVQLSFDMESPAEPAPLEEMEVLRHDLDRRGSSYVEVRLKRVAEGWLRGHSYALPTQGSHCGPFKAYWRRVYCSRACALGRECDGLIASMQAVRERDESNVQVRLATKALAWLRELRAPLADPCQDPPRTPYRPRGVTREQWAEEREQSQRRWAWNARQAARDAELCAECGLARERHYRDLNTPPDPAVCPRFVEPEAAASA